ncbi:MAG: hypothetical protein RR365_04045 [Bacteroides sp.]
MRALCLQNFEVTPPSVKVVGGQALVLFHLLKVSVIVVLALPLAPVVVLVVKVGPHVVEIPCALVDAPQDFIGRALPVELIVVVHILGEVVLIDICPAQHDVDVVVTLVAIGAENIPALEGALSGGVFLSHARGKATQLVEP